MNKINFYTNPMSRGQIARWALHEVGAEYTEHLLNYGDTGINGMKSLEYLAINPMGKVPAIVNGTDIVTECAAICAYLADTYPDCQLKPQKGEYANYYRWLAFTAGPLEQAITNNRLGFDISPDKEKMLGYGNYNLVVDTLAAHLEKNNYICSTRFTMADVYVGSQVIWGLLFGTLPERAAFSEYAERLTQRPAYQTANAIDTNLIEKMQASTN